MCSLINKQAIMFWRLSKKINADAAEGSVDFDDIDEMDVLATYTDLPSVKKMALDIVCKHTNCAAAGLLG